MKRVLLLFCLLASPALADWTQVSSDSIAPGTTRTIYRHEWTGAATDSTPVDVSSCTAGLEYRFDPSTGDASVDATVQVRTCQNSTDTWQRCRGNDNDPPTDSFVGLNAVTQGENYALAHAMSATTGGDTARVEIRCLDAADVSVGTGLPSAPVGSISSSSWCPGGTVQVIHSPVYAADDLGQAGAWACLLSSTATGKDVVNIVVGYDRDLAANPGLERRIDPALQAAWEFCNGNPATSGLDANQEYKCVIDVVTGAYITTPTVFFQNSFNRAVATTEIRGNGSSITPTTNSFYSSGFQTDGAISGLPGTWTRGQWWSLTDATGPDDISVGGATVDTIGTIVADAGGCSQQYGTPTIRVDTVAVHGLSDGSTTQREGDLIEIAGTAAYNGIEYVRQVIDTDTFCYVQNNSAGSASEATGTVRPMRNAAFAVAPNTTANSRVPGAPAAFVIGGGTVATANVKLSGFMCVFGTTINVPSGEYPYRKRCVLVTGAGLGVNNVEVSGIGCTQSAEVGQTCVEVDSLGGGSLAESITIQQVNADFSPDFGPDTIKIGLASHVRLTDLKLGHGGGVTVGKDQASAGGADPSNVMIERAQFGGCGVSCLKHVSGQLTIISAWFTSDVDGPGSAGSRKVDPGFLGWIGGSNGSGDTDFTCLSCEVFLQNESNLAIPYFKLGNARSIAWDGGDFSPGNDSGAILFGNPAAAMTIARLSLGGAAIRGGTSPVLIDTTNLTITKWDQLLDYDFQIKGIVAADDRLFAKPFSAATLRQLDCVAQAGTTLTTVDVTIQECNTSGAACATTGFAATMTVIDTNVSDAVATDAAIAANAWLKYVTGTVTWTLAGDVSCSLKYLVN